MVHHLMEAALEHLGRRDEPYSYGIAPDPDDAGRQIVYCDLPYVSPLQFNVEFEGGGGDFSREPLTKLIGQAITRRLEFRSSLT